MLTHVASVATMYYMPKSHASMQFQQLAMFATPQEASQWEAGDRAGHTAWQMADVIPTRNTYDAVEPAFRRHAGSTYRGGTKSGAHYLDALTDSVDRTGGIERPVEIWHAPGRPSPVLVDGHHRTLVGLATNRLIPVQHNEGSIHDVYARVFNGPGRSSANSSDWIHQKEKHG